MTASPELGRRVRPVPVDSACGELVESARSCTLELKVVPNAPHDEVAGWLGSTLKIKIHAPALDGRANDAVLAFLAERLGVSRRTITLVRGEKSRHKVIRIDGLTNAEVRARICQPV